MIDFANIMQYKENNRIEAKKALGGLPHSIWETYSAFANTLGGIILLGVVEQEDKSFAPIDLPNPERLIKDFWDAVNNKNKVSVNVLSDRDVTAEVVDGKHIIAIRVPRAQRSERPVYIDNNPILGSYRRNGEGDYRCTQAEVQAMIRDASVRTQDMLVLENTDLNVLDFETIRRYRIRMRNCRPGHVWEDLPDSDFLYRIGAVGRGEDGNLHPTAAGLLMFGFEYEITTEFNFYFLDYREELDPNIRWTDRIISSSGEWSGNIYDFYFRVYNKLVQDIKVPFKLEGGDRIDDTPVHKALREALANCLVNADYYGRQGIVVIKRNDEIVLSNPGGFRMDIDTAKCGGFSDPRNSVLLKMFNLIDIGERAGSGVPNIFSVWHKQGWQAPVIEEFFDPDRIKVTLPMKNIEKPLKSDDKKVTIKSDDKKVTIKMEAYRNAIIAYLTEHSSATIGEIEVLLGVKTTRAKNLMYAMIDQGMIEATGTPRKKVYKLKS